MFFVKKSILLSKKIHVFGNCEYIYIFRYLTYWRQRFLEEDLTNFCSIISTKTRDGDKGMSKCAI